MGTPVNKQEPANLCPICWGPGKPFGDPPTPQIVQIRLTRLLPGEFFTDAYEEQLLRTHWLEQQVDPCRFVIFDPPLQWFVEWAPTATLVAVRDLATLRFAFVATVPAICQVDMASDIAAPLGNIAWNGFANITWDLEGL